jgi:ribosomal protein S21
MNKQIKHHKSIVPGKSNSTKVINKDINFALRLWKKQLKSSDSIDKLKSLKEFEKPSITKRRQKQAAIYKQKISDMYSD